MSFWDLGAFQKVCEEDLFWGYGKEIFREDDQGPSGGILKDFWEGDSEMQGV